MRSPRSRRLVTSDPRDERPGRDPGRGRRPAQPRHPAARLSSARAMASQTAEDGVEALAAMRAGDVDLVLLDIVMPRMDGFQVLAEMKGDAALRDIPVIMISAVDDHESVIRCIEAGRRGSPPEALRSRPAAGAHQRRPGAQAAAHARARAAARHVRALPARRGRRGGAPARRERSAAREASASTRPSCSATCAASRRSPSARRRIA